MTGWGNLQAVFRSWVCAEATGLQDPRACASLGRVREGCCWRGVVARDRATALACPLDCAPPHVGDTATTSALLGKTHVAEITPPFLLSGPPTPREDSGLLG